MFCELGAVMYLPGPACSPFSRLWYPLAMAGSLGWPHLPAHRTCRWQNSAASGAGAGKNKEIATSYQKKKKIKKNQPKKEKKKQKSPSSGDAAPA